MFFEVEFSSATSNLSKLFSKFSYKKVISFFVEKNTFLKEILKYYKKLNVRPTL